MSSKLPRGPTHAGVRSRLATETQHTKSAVQSRRVACPIPCNESKVPLCFGDMSQTPSCGMIGGAFFVSGTRSDKSTVQSRYVADSLLCNNVSPRVASGRLDSVARLRAIRVLKKKKVGG